MKEYTRFLLLLADIIINQLYYLGNTSIFYVEQNNIIQNYSKHSPNVLLMYDAVRIQQEQVESRSTVPIMIMLARPILSYIVYF